ncbi:MAG: glycerol-3-phosphate 1-O-acyltransferase PlsY [Anaerolineaceae bacterium]
MISIFFSALIGYLLGNISSAYMYVRHVMHADIRELGSGNAGATNVNRILGLKVALQVFFLDVFKGVIAVLVGGWLAGSNGAMIAGLSVVAGHDYPAVLNFRGGKGMATTLGVMLMLLPQAALMAAILFVVVVAATRYVSLGSVMICLAIGPAAAVLGGSLSLVLLFGALGLIGIFQHRGNIARLLKGTESRLVLTRSTN